MLFQGLWRTYAAGIFRSFRPGYGESGWLPLFSGIDEKGASGVFVTCVSLSKGIIPSVIRTAGQGVDRPTTVAGPRSRDVRPACLIFHPSAEETATLPVERVAGELSFIGFSNVRGGCDVV